MDRQDVITTMARKVSEVVVEVGIKDGGVEGVELAVRGISLNCRKHITNSLVYHSGSNNNNNNNRNLNLNHRNPSHRHIRTALSRSRQVDGRGFRLYLGKTNLGVIYQSVDLTRQKERKTWRWIIPTKNQLLPNQHSRPLKMPPLYPLQHNPISPRHLTKSHTRTRDTASLEVTLHLVDPRNQL